MFRHKVDEDDDESEAEESDDDESDVKNKPDNLKPSLDKVNQSIEKVSALKVCSIKGILLPYPIPVLVIFTYQT